MTPPNPLFESSLRCGLKKGEESAELEEGFGVLGCGFGALFGGDLKDGGEALIDEAYPGGFVSLATVGDRGHPRGIGFDHEVLEADGFEGGAEVVAAFVGDGAVDAEDPSERESAFGVVGGSGEAVEEVGDAFGAFFENIEEVGFGFATVEDDGFVVVFGEFELGEEGVELFFSGGVVPMVVEADFAEGDDFGVAEELFNFGESGFCEGFGVGGVPTDDGVDLGETVGELDGDAVPFGVDADDDKLFDSSVFGFLDGGGGVGEGPVVVKVAVGVDQAHLGETLPKDRGGSTQSRDWRKLGKDIYVFEEVCAHISQFGRLS